MHLVVFHLNQPGTAPRAKRLLSHWPGTADEICPGSQAYPVEVRRFSSFGKVFNLLLILIGASERYVSRKYSVSTVPDADRVVCHDLLLLPLALHWYGDKVLFDAREFYPGEFENSLLWRFTAGRLANSLCSRFLPRVADVTTVSDGVAQLYLERFGIEARVVLSMSEYHQLKPSTASADSPLRAVYMGNATPDRNLPELIRCAALVPHVHIDLYLTGLSQAEQDRLNALCVAGGNVRLREPVAFERIVSILNNYDVGLFVAPPSTVNLRHAMPNKLFEYLQARLAIVVSPLPDVAAFVRRHGVGVVCEGSSAEQIAAALNSLTADRVMSFKARCDELSKEYCAEQFARQMLGDLSG